MDENSVVEKGPQTLYLYIPWLLTDEIGQTVQFKNTYT